MFKKKVLSFLILAVMAFSMVFAVAGNVNAQVNEILNNDQLKDVADEAYNADDGVPGKNIQTMIVTVINTILGLLGIIFLVIIIYAGFLWMTAGGNDDQVGKAKKLIINSIIGIVIIVGAYAISYFVLNAVINV